MDNLPKILIVEDEMIIAADISMQLTKLGYEIIGMCTSGEDAIGFIERNPPEIILMDVILKGEMNGIETAQHIQDHHSIPLIFLTSNHDDATFQQALQTNPYAFIAKPFQKSELVRALKLISNRISTEKSLAEEHSTSEDKDHISVMEDRLFIRHNGQMVKVNIADILYAEADRTYCKVFTVSKEFLLSIPLSKFELNLPSTNFLRTHRSFVVNLSKIDTVSEYCEFVTLGGQQIPVSRRQKDELIKRLKLV